MRPEKKFSPARLADCVRPKTVVRALEQVNPAFRTVFLPRDAVFAQPDLTAAAGEIHGVGREAPGDIFPVPQFPV
jgi:hypothetical protein